MSVAGTKSLILDAAEEAFADLGFAAASLRQIVSSAGVNLAAVNYHFGTKERLIHAVFARRIGPLNEERLRLLDAAESKKGGASLEKIVEALVAPALRLSRDVAKGGPNFMRLLGRTVAEPSKFLQEMLRAQFGDVVLRFTKAFSRALPRLSEEELAWRIHFAVGVMAHTMCDPQNLRICPGRTDPVEIEEVIAKVVRFISAGMRGPAGRTK